MTHYEQRLEKDLTRIKDRVAEIANNVQESLKNAVHALVTGNHTLAYTTILSDLPINRHMRETEKLCNAFLATHLPSAGHLRLISSTLRANISLERIGDYSVTICREAVQLSHPPKGSLVREIELMAEEARNILHLTLSAFTEGNADKARATKAMAVQVERTFDTIYANLISDGKESNIKDLFSLFVVFSMLGRVADQAKNICEDTIFAVTGETKAPKTYKILFLDEDNSCQSQIAEAIAGKLFPKICEYSSAGRQPAEALDPQTVRFLDQHGIDVATARAKVLDLSPQELSEYHVVVSLQGPVKSYIKEVPFHTAALEWDVGSLATDLSEEQSQQRLEELYREIALQVRDLMETLRGKEM
ncbi:MAG: phosphate signaling complex protein PhoU [Pseudomonadota bacterium]